MNKQPQHNVKPLDINQIQKNLKQKTSKPMVQSVLSKESVQSDASVDQSATSKMAMTTEIQKGLNELKRILVSMISEGYTQIMCTNKKFKSSPESNYYEFWISKDVFTILIYNKDKVIISVEYKWLSLDALVNGKKGSIADVNHFYQQFLGDLEAKKVCLLYTSPSPRDS